MEQIGNLLFYWLFSIIKAAFLNFVLVLFLQRPCWGVPLPGSGLPASHERHYCMSRPVACEDQWDKSHSYAQQLVLRFRQFSDEQKGAMRNLLKTIVNIPC